MPLSLDSTDICPLPALPKASPEALSVNWENYDIGGHWIWADNFTGINDLEGNKKPRLAVMRATNRLKTNKQKSQSVHAKEVAPQCSDLHISLTSKSQVWSWEETEFPLGLRQEGHPTFKKKSLPNETCGAPRCDDPSWIMEQPNVSFLNKLNTTLWNVTAFTACLYLTQCHLHN